MGSFLGPFFGRNGPVWEVCRSQISSPFLGLGPPFVGVKQRRSVSLQIIKEITQWIDRKFMSFDTLSMKNVFLTKMAHRKNVFFFRNFELPFLHCVLYYLRHSR